MMKIDESLVYLILAIVDEIPAGKVASYGQIARLAGYPKHARMVGSVLKRSEFYGRFPCHRVVNSSGRCAPGWDEQAELLREEGVEVSQNHVNMKDYQWNP